VSTDRTICFAYGSNLDLAQLLGRCPGARVRAVGWLEGHALRFAGHSKRWAGGVATLHPSLTACTPGLLFDIDARDLAALDRHEGHPTRYVRRPSMVRARDGAEVRAWVYALPLDVPEARPSDAYVAAIRRGYEHHDLDVGVLDAAVRASARERVFVYGTLMRGEANHRWLAGARLLAGAARTAACYELHDLGAFPALALDGADAVAGELYEVDAHDLDRLDELEGHPAYYVRSAVRLHDGSTAVAYTMERAGLAEASLGVILGGNWRRRRRRGRP
jgi:gamma-glutamylcyclotransferase (GGCT)/AIG2-like uncharacterized protein YtfP